MFKIFLPKSLLTFNYKSVKNYFYLWPSKNTTCHTTVLGYLIIKSTKNGIITIKNIIYYIILSHSNLYIFILELICGF